MRRGRLYLRTSQGDNAFDEKAVCRKQFANGNHILVIDMPDSLSCAHRIDEVNVCPGQTCRMRTVKLNFLPPPPLIDAPGALHR